MSYSISETESRKNQAYNNYKINFYDKYTDDYNNSKYADVDMNFCEHFETFISLIDSFRSVVSKISYPANYKNTDNTLTSLNGDISSAIQKLEGYVPSIKDASNKAFQDLVKECNDLWYNCSDNLDTCYKNMLKTLSKAKEYQSLADEEEARARTASYSSLNIGNVIGRSKHTEKKEGYQSDRDKQLVECNVWIDKFEAQTAKMLEYITKGLSKM